MIHICIIRGAGNEEVEEEAGGEGAKL